MTAATHKKFNLLMIALAAMFVFVVCAVGCAENTEAASSEPESVAVSDKAPESSVESSEASELESSCVSTTESSEDISNDGSEATDVSEDNSEPENVSAEISDVSSTPSESSGEDNSDVELPDESSEPSDESSVPSEEDESSADPDDDTSSSSGNDASSGTGTNNEPDEEDEEKTVLCGDTPVIIEVNGVEYALTSYEEAAELIPFATTPKGYTILFKKDTICDGLVLISNGDGTYVHNTGKTSSANQLSMRFHNHWCRKCGVRSGDGTHGTCVRKTCDTECRLCGEPCKKLACHTCDDE